MRDKTRNNSIGVIHSIQYYFTITDTIIVIVYLHEYFIWDQRNDPYTLIHILVYLFWPDLRPRST